MKFKQIKECKLTLTEKWANSYLVTYPVSYRYNGLIERDGKLYNGFEVAKPKIPKGYELRTIGCGLQLNAYPPYATSFLYPLDGKHRSKSELMFDLKNC